MSAEWAGFTTVGQCEFADYPTKVLEKHWPNVPRWRNVRDATAESIRERGIGEITLLSGGFPCQPHSLAGKRQASSDERDLWPEFRRVISEVTPKWVLGENVPGLFTSNDRRFFGGILNDLASLGYSVGWCTYGADDVGAIHKRDRVFIIAHAKIQQSPMQIKPEPCQEEQREPGGMGKPSILSNTNGISGLQTDSETCAIGSERDSRNNVMRGDWKQKSETYWDVHQSPVCGVDAGSTNELYEDRMKGLGNMVNPQQVYPILQAIADIERDCEEDKP